MNQDEIRTQYDKIGHAYVQAQREFIAKNGDFATDFILRAVGDLRGKTLLDVGCCAGDQLVIYEANWAKVFGVEPSKLMIDMAANQLEEVHKSRRLRQGDASFIPFDDEQFDVVTARMSLHYAPDLDEAWKEIGRVIRPSGILAFVAPHPFNTFDRNEGQKYAGTRQISYRLLDAVDAINYHHPFGDYFSPAFFDKFVVEDFTEFPGVVPRVKDSKGPSAFGVKARRKG